MKDLIEELKPQIDKPIPCILGAASILIFVLPTALLHMKEIRQVHGTMTTLFFFVAILGWVLTIFANNPDDDSFDWIPTLIMIVASIFNGVAFSGFNPLPYQTWSFHSFFFWFVNAAFAVLGTAYTAWICSVK